MEKSTKLREANVVENVVTAGDPEISSKEDSQKKKKLVYFEIDDCNNAQKVYEVPNFEIEELFHTPNKRFGGSVFTYDDGLTEGTQNWDQSSSSLSCTLPAVSRDVSRMIFDEFGIDLIELQNRILELEKQLKNDNLGLPPIINDLKSQIENFRNKLETAERCRRIELQKEPFCQRLQYRRSSSERGRKIREKFLSICDKEIGKSTKDWLKQPSFDVSQYEDEEILWFLQHMFLELELTTKFDIHLPILRNFLYEVYKNYNKVPFHNFRHCFCVAQMMYVIICSVDIPSKMGDLDTLILLTSSICHDLDHPGYNNIYQINARTELALLYNDISPLENHHCSVTFRILENPDCNIFASLGKETFKEIREGIIRCILATDMARHNEILTQFKEAIPDFHFSNKGHKNLLSMILIKVADISNEARPLNVAEPWLDRLLMEFFKQSDAEKQEGLPVTPFMDREKITKPSSQCSFIGFVLLPLFEALGELLPELHDLIIAPAKYALEYYRRLNEAAKDERMRRKSVAESVNAEYNEDLENSGMVKSGSGHSVRSRRSFCTSCTQVRQRSRSSEEFELDATPPSSPGAISALLEDLEDLDEREEIEDELDEEETVTEVEISEKTIKFKISTESSATAFTGKKSCPGSRKGSREKNQYSENDVEYSRNVRDEDGKLLRRSFTSEAMESTRKGSCDFDRFSSDKTSRKYSCDFDRGEAMRKGPRGKDNRTKMNYDSKKMCQYRRKSLAVVERSRDLSQSKRRSSVCNTQETKGDILTKKEGGGVAIVKNQTIQAKRDANDVIFDKLNSSTGESKFYRDFETSCWGLQNLKMNQKQFNASPVISNQTLKNSYNKNIVVEKSKSEDNLSIKTSQKLGNVVLCNNINVSKTDESIEKQLSREPEKKRKLGNNGGHLSILSRLKQFKDRMSLGRDSDSFSESINTYIGPNSAEKTGKSISDNQNTSRACEDDCERSRTLPKTKKPHRTLGKMKKGWRAVIGKYEGNSSSSLDNLPPLGSPSPVLAEARRKSSVEEAKTRARSATEQTPPPSSAAADKKKSTWLPSPKKSGFLSKIGRNEEENYTRYTLLNNLTSSFRKRGNRNDEENGASSSSSVQEGSKPNSN